MEMFELARKNMVTNQLMPNHVSDARLLEAALNLPRHEFVDAEARDIAYHDGRQHLGEGRFMLQPEVMYRMIQALKLSRDDAVLEIASGTGYTTAVLAQLAGSVVSIESIPDLANKAANTLSKMKVDNYSVKNGELWAGAPERAPFDAIFINGKVGSIPDSLIAQLKTGGKLVCIEERERGSAKAVMCIKYDSSFDKVDLFDAYAELVK